MWTVPLFASPMMILFWVIVTGSSRDDINSQTIKIQRSLGESAQQSYLFPPSSSKLESVCRHPDADRVSGQEDEWLNCCSSILEPRCFSSSYRLAVGS